MGSKDHFSDDLSEVYHALRSPRRRYVIQIITENQEEIVSIRLLAREVAAREEGIQPDHATGEPYRNAYNALSQTHLPTLSDAGVIIYDSDRQTVTTGPKFRLAALLLALNRTTYRTLYGETDDKIE